MRMNWLKDKGELLIGAVELIKSSLWVGKNILSI